MNEIYAFEKGETKYVESYVVSMIVNPLSRVRWQMVEISRLEPGPPCFYVATLSETLQFTSGFTLSLPFPQSHLEAALLNEPSILHVPLRRPEELHLNQPHPHVSSEPFTTVLFPLRVFSPGRDLHRSALELLGLPCRFPDTRCSCLSRIDDRRRTEGMPQSGYQHPKKPLLKPAGMGNRTRQSDRRCEEPTVSSELSILFLSSLSQSHLSGLHSSQSRPNTSLFLWTTQPLIPTTVPPFSHCPQISAPSGGTTRSSGKPNGGCKRPASLMQQSR